MAVIPYLELHSGAQLSGLTETPVLPQKTFDICDKFVPFPEQTDECQGFNFPVRQTRAPRFSIFRTDAVHLRGFRLLSTGEQLFTDACLTAVDLVEETELFNRKLQNGQTENINFANVLEFTDSVIEIAREGPILLPCSDEPSNFGSWIYRFIPKILLSQRSSQFHAVMVYQQPWMTEILRFIGLTNELIHHEPTRQYLVRQPVVPSLPAPWVFMRQEVRECLEKLHERVTDNVSLGERIYVSRRAQAIKKPRFRALENETGLVAALEELGFQEFCPEQYSFQQQISIFDKAKVIVGSGGSNMFGCIFARNAEMILDIESCHEWSHAHANLLASTRSSWSMIRGKQVGRGQAPHVNWTIDIDAVIQGLRFLLG